MTLADLIPEEARGPRLTRDELARAQEEAGVAFPEDLAELLESCLPIGRRFPDWRNEPALAMTRWRKQLLDGILFDVEVSAFWLDDWGDRPATRDEALSIAAEAVHGAPALVPIYAHRGIPNEPLDPGNPVLSVVQMDAIVYGGNLEEYLRNEFHRGGPAATPLALSEPIREIRFWTALAFARD